MKNNHEQNLFCLKKIHTHEKDLTKREESVKVPTYSCSEIAKRRPFPKNQSGTTSLIVEVRVGPNFSLLRMRNAGLLQRMLREVGRDCIVSNQDNSIALGKRAY